MNNLLFRFAVRLHTEGSEIRSLLFHRWFPNGDGEAIHLKTKNPKAELKVWIEQCECVEATLIAKRLSNEEVPEVGVIAGGPLRGTLELSSGFSKDEFDAVTNGTQGEAYESLGKKVIKRLTIPVKRFVDILRLNFGQYWLEKFALWDSQEQSLTNYCKYLNLRWSTDGIQWADFLPGEAISRMTLVLDRTGAKFEEYLTADDWNSLRDVIGSDYEPGQVARALSRAHEAADSGTLSDAFVNAGIALEMALRQLFKDVGLEASDKQNVQSKLLTGVMLTSNVEKDVLRRAIRAVHIRNDVVHKAFEPTDSDKPALYALLGVTGLILRGPIFGFPSAHHGNARMSPDEWDKCQNE